MEQLDKEDFQFSSLQAQKMAELYTKIVKKVDDFLEYKVKYVLEKMGFTFSSKEEFLKFCSKRVFRLVDTNSLPHSFEFYLDYKSIQNKGTFICGFKEDYKVNYHDTGYSVKVDIEPLKIEDFITVKDKLDKQQISTLTDTLIS